MTASVASAETGTTTNRHTLVTGCFGLKAENGKFVVQSGNGYVASANAVGGAWTFRMQATDLGKYLLYGEAAEFPTVDDGLLAQDEIVTATAPSNSSDWTAQGSNGVFTFTNQATNRGLAVNDAGQVVSVAPAQADAFLLAPAQGCQVYPEISLNATGEPNTSSPAYGEVEGTADPHMHLMAYEFLGGHAHCGQPWHKFGAPFALADCADHEPDGCQAALETGLGGDPCHNTDGWPTFQGWPQSESLTHESAYYRWLERAHLAGLRVFVNLFVENRVLCEAYPDFSAVQGEPKSNCDEMDTVRRQNRRIEQLEDYIDAQSGGPGEGWFRIVTNPFQARRVINAGDLAVIKGMEVSEPFDCGFMGFEDDGPGNPTPDPRCSKAHISEVLDELWTMGVRQMEITNKFDNQLTGVAGDGGSTGVLVNGGQFLTSGTTWDFDPPPANPGPGDCGEDGHNHDRVPATSGSPVTQDEIFGNGLEVFATIPNILPIYGPNDKCNSKGLQDGDPGETDFGSHALEGIMDRRFVFDPDHMSVLARDEALDMLEAEDYSGIVSSHSWSTANTLPRVYGLGGFISPYAGGSSGFAGAWEELRSAAVRGELGDQYFGIGYGADANGFGSQGGPRNPGEDSDVDYPFTGIDGAVTFDQQTSGVGPDAKTYDINTDGVDHYGLYADWLEDLRQIKGDEIAEDMNRGAEAYLQMWERTYGVGEVDCSQWGDEDFTFAGLGTEIKLNKRFKRNLLAAGQPVYRKRAWTWCAGDGGRDSELNVKAYFDKKRNQVQFAISNLPEHEVDGFAPGDSASGLDDVGKEIAENVWLSRTDGRRAFAWVTDGSTVTYAGVVSQSATKNKFLRLSGRLKRVAAL
jgi:hypothetical protein